MSEISLADLDNHINDLIDSKIAALNISGMINDAINAGHFFGGCDKNSLGVNPTGTPDNDTPEFWRTMKSGMYWIKPTNSDGTGYCLKDQPNTYGWLYHFGGDSTEVQQWFIPQPNPTYIAVRGANGNGWSGDNTNRWYKYSYSS